MKEVEELHIEGIFYLCLPLFCAKACGAIEKKKNQFGRFPRDYIWTSGEVVLY